MKDNLYKLSCFFYRFVKNAGRKEDIQSKYPGIDLSLFIQRDPSDNLKYLEWEAKVLKSGKALAPEICDVIYFFNKYKDNLEKKDINQYKVEEFINLRDRLFDIRDNKVEKKEKYKVNKDEVSSGSDVIYESDKFIVLLIENLQAAKFYGGGTRWCIVNEGKFDEYLIEGTVFFFIIKKGVTYFDFDNNYKVAVAFDRDYENNIIDIYYTNASDNSSDNANDFGIDEISKIEPKMKTVAKMQPLGLMNKIKSGNITSHEICSLYNVYMRNKSHYLLRDLYDVLKNYSDLVPIFILDSIAYDTNLNIHLINLSQQILQERNKK